MHVLLSSLLRIINVFHAFLPSRRRPLSFCIRITSLMPLQTVLQSMLTRILTYSAHVTTSYPGHIEKLGRGIRTTATRPIGIHSHALVGRDRIKHAYILTRSTCVVTCNLYVSCVTCKQLVGIHGICMYFVDSPVLDDGILR